MSIPDPLRAAFLNLLADILAAPTNPPPPAHLDPAHALPAPQTQIQRIVLDAETQPWYTGRQEQETNP